MSRSVACRASAPGRWGAAPLALLLAALACATASRGSPEGRADAGGEQLYREHCGSCHRLRAPSEETRDRWAWAVERFGPRAHLSPGDRQLVLAYLQSHAKDAAPAPSEAR